MVAADVAFFTYEIPPDQRHELVYLDRGYAWRAGKVTCVLGSNYGERWAFEPLVTDDQSMFETELITAHQQLFGCVVELQGGPKPATEEPI